MRVAPLSGVRVTRLGMEVYLVATRIVVWRCCFMWTQASTAAGRVGIHQGLMNTCPRACSGFLHVLFSFGFW